MTLWVVRAGDEGQQEKGAIENNIVTIGWNRLPDLSIINDYESLEKIYREKYPESEHEKETNYDRSVSLHAGEVWSFIGKIKIGDLVALPSKFSEYIHIGEVSGNYEFKGYADNIKHTLPVRWIKVVSRNEIPEEFQTSFNTQLTVFAITRHDAENKIKKLIDAQQESQYFLIQVSDFGSPTVLEKGFYEHLDWFENTADSAHGEVKQGDIILVYFASKSIDYKKTLKMVYKVSKVTDNNVRFYLTLFKKLNGISYEEIKRYIDNAQLNNDSFWGIGNQSFNIGKISKADFDKVFELDGSTLDPIVDEKTISNRA